MDAPSRLRHARAPARPPAAALDPVPPGEAPDPQPLDEVRRTELTALAERLGVRFRDLTLLDLALRHGSFAHERGEVESYERLEFLGDAVLSLVVADYLYRRHPDYTEGQLAKQRARLVSEPALAELGRRLGLGRYVLLGRGEEKAGGRERPALLADAVEGVLGAIYVDAGYGVAHAVATRWVSELADELERAGADFKSQLQERLQRQRLVPRYRVAREEGPDHAKAFTVQVQVDGRVIGRGHGRSKKEAEQAAAAEALAWLDREARPLRGRRR